MIYNVGKKIKTVVWDSAIIEAILAFISAIIWLCLGDVPFLVVFFSFLGALGSIAMIALFLYGFGELVDCAEIIALNTQKDEREEFSKSLPTTQQQKCEACDSTNSSYPGKHSGHNSENSAHDKDGNKTIPPTAPIPVPVTPYEGTIICPTCKTKQVEKRTSCWKCGQEFINGQSDIPYWCLKCGEKGPYGDTCPKCGSQAKVYNRP